VIFEQVHRPGERMQSDFTHMQDLQVTFSGEAFPHLLFHSVLTYSNVEAVSLCFGKPLKPSQKDLSKLSGSWEVCQSSIALIINDLTQIGGL
jgi:hypothetical protein